MEKNATAESVLKQCQMGLYSKYYWKIKNRDFYLYLFF